MYIINRIPPSLSLKTTHRFTANFGDQVWATLTPDEKDRYIRKAQEAAAAGIDYQDSQTINLDGEQDADSSASISE